MPQCKIHKVTWRAVSMPQCKIHKVTAIVMQLSEKVLPLTEAEPSINADTVLLVQEMKGKK